MKQPAFYRWYGLRTYLVLPQPPKRVCPYDGKTCHLLMCADNPCPSQKEWEDAA